MELPTTSMPFVKLFLDRGQISDSKTDAALLDKILTTSICVFRERHTGRTIAAFYFISSASINIVYI